MIAKESSISNKDKIILISLFYFMIFQNVLENYLCKNKNSKATLRIAPEDIMQNEVKVRS